MTGLLLLVLTQAAVSAGPVLVDDFERAETWSAHPADGVRLTLAGDRGKTGRALRLDFAFSGGGYAIARRATAIELPAMMPWM